MQDFDGVFALLQDIKRMLCGIALLLAGFFLFYLADGGVLLSLVRLFFCAAGATFIYDGYTRHKLISKQE